MNQFLWSRCMTALGMRTPTLKHAKQSSDSALDVAGVPNSAVDVHAIRASVVIDVSERACTSCSTRA